MISRQSWDPQFSNVHGKRRCYYCFLTNSTIKGMGYVRNYNCITKSDKLHLGPAMLVKALQYCTLLIAGCVWRYVYAGGECKEMEATVKHAQTKLTHRICLGHSEPRYCHCWWLYRKESADQEDGTAGYYLSFQHTHPGELLIHTTCTSSILYFFCIST